MKTKILKNLLCILLLGISFIGFSQSNNSGLRLSIRGGYDIPAFGNNTPYIDYKGGLEAGASLDYYWNRIGIGADFDYINNKPKSTYPTSNLFLGVTPITNFNLTENKITRIFYGIGPSFKYQKNNNSSWELKLRGGLASFKGGKTELTGMAGTTQKLLNFHAGYKTTNVLSAKASLQYNHFFNQNIGFNIGAYYLQHFKVPELVDPTLGISTGYYSFNTGSGAQSDTNVNTLDVLNVRKEPCNCEIHSVGVYAGLVLKFGGAKKIVDTPCPVCGKVHYPQCCNTCGCGVTITARDKFTKELLPNTDVVLTDNNGNVIQTGTTNNYGVVVFNNVIPNDYIVKGKLYNVDLAQNTIAKAEFANCKANGSSIQKEILYTDENFIIKGKVVICNTTRPLSGVNVVLKNKNRAEQKTTVSDANGEYVFQALQNSDYTIFGKKDNYMSQTETLSTKEYNRNTTLFIKLEICMDEADCGKSITLKNIHYDLDKYSIRDDAKPELNRLVQFMTDNPGVSVELSSHTDSRASNKYNATLSQNRANAAVDYIVSQGISRSRLTGIGYGETRLLNRCADGVPCTEPEHQINRRTEVKVICPK